MNVLTQQGYDELMQEHKRLLEEKSRLSSAIGQARLLGDLSENADYHAAREQMSLTLQRLNSIEERLVGVQIVKKPTNGKVHIGAKVVLKDLEDPEDMEMTLLLASSAELHVKGVDKVSTESLLGKVLLGKTKGDIVEYETPTKATMRFQIVAVL